MDFYRRKINKESFFKNADLFIIFLELLNALFDHGNKLCIRFRENESKANQEFLFEKKLCQTVSDILSCIESNLPNQIYHRKKFNHSEEMPLWNRLLSFEFSIDDVNNGWKASLLALLNSRFQNVIPVTFS